MKLIKVHDDIHADLKRAATNADPMRSMERTADSLLKHALWQLKSGRVTLAKLDAAEKRRDQAKR